MPSDTGPRCGKCNDPPPPGPTAALPVPCGGITEERMPPLRSQAFKPPSLPLQLAGTLAAPAPPLPKCPCAVSAESDDCLLKLGVNGGECLEPGGDVREGGGDIREGGGDVREGGGECLDGVADWREAGWLGTFEEHAEPCSTFKLGGCSGTPGQPERGDTMAARSVGPTSQRPSQLDELLEAQSRPYRTNSPERTHN